jgi:hypothetical protein
MNGAFLNCTSTENRIVSLQRKRVEIVILSRSEESALLHHVCLSFGNVRDPSPNDV